jgi:hypothetical protein
MDLIERDITLTCVSNEIGGPYVSGARWLGVRLTDVLDRAGVGGTADQILSTDVDGMTISTPLAVATDGRDAMLAVGMNGEALPREHGFPVRMVVPGLYGFVSACKWITRMTLTTCDAQQAYWTERGWATDAPVKIASRIDTPKSFEEIDAGDTFIAGIAWAQHRGIGGVEVQVDGGAWQPAELGPSAGIDYWRQWYLPWEARPGEHSLVVRAMTHGRAAGPVEGDTVPGRCLRLPADPRSGALTLRSRSESGWARAACRLDTNGNDTPRTHAVCAQSRGERRLTTQPDQLGPIRPSHRTESPTTSPTTGRFPTCCAPPPSARPASRPLPWPSRSAWPRVARTSRRPRTSPPPRTPAWLTTCPTTTCPRTTP